MAICWERAVPLAFHLCCFYLSAVLIVPVQFGVQDRMWKSIVSVPGHCLCIYFIYGITELYFRTYLWNHWIILQNFFMESPNYISGLIYGITELYFLTYLWYPWIIKQSCFSLSAENIMKSFIPSVGFLLLQRFSVGLLVVLSSFFIFVVNPLIYKFAVLMHWWDRNSSRGPNNLYVHE